MYFSYLSLSKVIKTLARDLWSILWQTCSSLFWSLLLQNPPAFPQLKIWDLPRRHQLLQASPLVKPSPKTAGVSAIVVAMKSVSEQIVRNFKSIHPALFSEPGEADSPEGLVSTCQRTPIYKPFTQCRHPSECPPHPAPHSVTEEELHFVKTCLQRWRAEVEHDMNGTPTKTLFTVFVAVVIGSIFNN